MLKTFKDDDSKTHKENEFRQTIADKYGKKDGSDTFPVKSYHKNYLSKVIISDRNLRKLALSQVAGCPSGQKECYTANLFKFVQSKIKYLSDPKDIELIQHPFDTLNLGAGDCEDLSILLASMLRNVGVESHLVIVPNHMYVFACGLEPTYFRNYMQNQKVKHSEKSIRRNSIWYWVFNDNKYLNYNFNIQSSGLFDLYLFSGRNDLEKFKKNQPYSALMECTQKGLTRFNSSCYVTGGNILAIIPKGQNIKVTLDYSIDDNTDIAMYEMNGKSCIPLDPSFRGDNVYPGMEMPRHIESEKEILYIK